VTAAGGTGVVTTMMLARARRISVRRLIRAGGQPLAAEIHGRIRQGRDGHGAEQAKRKKNTHPHILFERFARRR
jgi:hypothetical protein